LLQTAAGPKSNELNSIAGFKQTLLERVMHQADILKLFQIGVGAAIGAHDDALWRRELAWRDDRGVMSFAAVGAEPVWWMGEGG
jgi:hypothetical protein